MNVVKCGCLNSCAQSIARCVLLGTEEQAIGGEGSSSNPFFGLSSSKSIVVADNLSLSNQLGILRNSAGLPRRKARIMNRVSIRSYCYCAAFASSFPSRAESIIIPLFSSTPSLSLSGFPNTTSPLAMLSSSNPSRPFKTPRI